MVIGNGSISLPLRSPRNEKKPLAASPSDCGGIKKFCGDRWRDVMAKTDGARIRSRTFSLFR